MKEPADNKLGEAFEMIDRATNEKLKVYLPTENTVIISTFKLDPIDLKQHSQVYRVTPPAVRKETTRSRRESAADFDKSPYLFMYETQQYF